MQATITELKSLLFTQETKEQFKAVASLIVKIIIAFFLVVQLLVQAFYFIKSEVSSLQKENSVSKVENEVEVKLEVEKIDQEVVNSFIEEIEEVSLAVIEVKEEEVGYFTANAEMSVEESYRNLYGIFYQGYQQAKGLSDEEMSDRSVETVTEKLSAWQNFVIEVLKKDIPCSLALKKSLQERTNLLRDFVKSYSLRFDPMFDYLESI